MRRVPSKISGSGHIATAINELIDYCQSLRPLESKDTLLEHGPVGVIRRARGFNNSSTNDFPFEIYQKGNWLTYRVKFGVVITTGEPILTTTGIETDFTLTSGVVRYWFVLTIASGGASAAITISTSAPAWSVNIIPIGWVDTDTGSASSHAIVYQFLHDNVFVPCAI